MTNSTDFARLVAPAIDRVQLALFTIMTPEKSAELGAKHQPIPIEAAFQLSSAIPAHGASWDEFRLVTRYNPSDAVRQQVEMLSSIGVLIHDDATIRFTPAARAAAQDVVNLTAVVFADLWHTSALALPGLVERTTPVAEKAIATSQFAAFTSRLIDESEPNDASRLKRNLRIIRRARADAHAAAWSVAGKTALEMPAFTEGPGRNAIEQQTNINNATIWEAISEADRLEVLAGIAALNGTA
jgi:hypothetical protein